MRFRISAVVFCGLLTFAATARSQDLPTTHDHGITITPDHLTTAIQETQDFWGPVRKHLTGDQCNVAAQELRAASVAYLKSIHDGLHDRLFQRTEVEAMDLVHYLSHRLRRFEVYRRLRTTIGNDAVMLSLLDAWEREFRAIDVLPADQKPARVQALVALVDQTMQASGIPADKAAEAHKLWVVQADVFQKMAATEAGKMMTEFEVQADKQLAPDASLLLLHISNAADWVLITRDDKHEIGREDFLKAWSQLEGLRAKQTAASKSTVNR